MNHKDETFLPTHYKEGKDTSWLRWTGGPVSFSELYQLYSTSREFKPVFINDHYVYAFRKVDGAVWTAANGWYKSHQAIPTPTGLDKPTPSREKSPLDVQVGGSHYKHFKIQPLEFFIANQVPYAEAAVVKYVLRHRMKNGLEDLKKAIHIIEVLIHEEYGVAALNNSTQEQTHE